MSEPSRAVRAGYVLASGLYAVAVVSAAAVVLSILVGLARHGDSLLYGDTLRVPLQLSPDEIRSLPADLELHGWPGVDQKIGDPTTAQMLLRSLQDVGPIVLFAIGLWLLRGFLRSVLDGEPFGGANVQRLRGIGFILVVGVPAAEILNWSLRQALFNRLPPHPSLDLGVAGFAFPASALIGGLGAFILAEVFAYGLRLREDVEATI